MQPSLENCTWQSLVIQLRFLNSLKIVLLGIRDLSLFCVKPGQVVSAAEGGGICFLRSADSIAGAPCNLFAFPAEMTVNPFPSLDFMNSWLMWWISISVLSEPPPLYRTVLWFITDLVNLTTILLISLNGSGLTSFRNSLFRLLICMFERNDTLLPL